MRALAQVDEWPAPTVAVGVTTATGVVAQRGPAERPMALASVTKVLSAITAWVAAEEGTLPFDLPVGTTGATVRHLLAHASGLAPDRAQVLAPPGRRRIYSNAGFDLLGLLLADHAGMPFATYLHEAVVEPLGLRTAHLAGSPAHDAVASVDDLLAVARELLVPTLVAPATLAEATAVAFPGLDGVLPGFGPQQPNDWGLGVEVRGHKHPHWTGVTSSPRTFGHFGRAGTFLWVDPDAGVACACLTDLAFGAWAAEAWPRLADDILTEMAEGRPARARR